MSGSGAAEPAVHRRRLDADVPAAKVAVAHAAEAWGADWQGVAGRLVLPVAAGLRRGRVSGHLEFEDDGDGSALTLAVDEAIYRVHRPAVAILVLGALGGVATMLWPFSPQLLGVAPVGAVLALAAWLLVVSRLTTSTPDDFLALVEELSAENDDDSSTD